MDRRGTECGDGIPNPKPSLDAQVGSIRKLPRHCRYHAFLQADRFHQGEINFRLVAGERRHGLQQPEYDLH